MKSDKENSKLLKEEKTQAHVHAQEINIHVDSNEEKHLPHEAWQLVQQKQGRLKPSSKVKSKATIKLDLSEDERKNLRKNKIKKSDILAYAPDELAVLLNTSEVRAKEIHALVDFQRIPSIGIEFAKDLVFLNYYSIEDLIGKNGAILTNQYEKKKGYKTDPCVEDQFRLAVHFATNVDHSKKWWDFTSERKKFRKEFGYPLDRPVKNWTEVVTI